MADRKMVLLADRDHAVLAVLRARLARDYDVVSTQDGQEALGLVRSRLPDVVLCAHDLPRLSGSELAAKLAHETMTQRIPVVYLVDAVAEGSGDLARTASATDLAERIAHATRR